MLGKAHLASKDSPSAGIWARASGEVPEVTGHRRKGDPFHEVAKNWAELCSSILGKSEPVKEELRRGAEGISK